MHAIKRQSAELLPPAATLPQEPRQTARDTNHSGLIENWSSEEVETEMNSVYFGPYNKYPDPPWYIAQNIWQSHCDAWKRRANSGTINPSAISRTNDRDRTTSWQREEYKEEPQASSKCEPCTHKHSTAPCDGSSYCQAGNDSVCDNLIQYSPEDLHLPSPQLPPIPAPIPTPILSRSSTPFAQPENESIDPSSNLDRPINLAENRFSFPNDIRIDKNVERALSSESARFHNFNSQYRDRDSKPQVISYLQETGHERSGSLRPFARPNHCPRQFEYNGQTTRITGRGRRRERAISHPSTNSFRRASSTFSDRRYDNSRQRGRHRAHSYTGRSNFCDDQGYRRVRNDVYGRGCARNAFHYRVPRSPTRTLNTARLHLHGRST